MSGPESTYYAVIFSNRRTDDDADYPETAARMEALAAAMPGFLGVESVRGPDGAGITISYWRSEDDIARWKREAEHVEARREGRARWYRRYRVRVARVEREYSFEKEQDRSMSDEDIKYGLAGVVADETAISKVMPEINSLTYRGYKVQDLATACRFEEVAYLIWHGELPDARELEEFKRAEKGERGVSKDTLDVLKTMNRKAHPMDTLRTAVSFIGQEDPNANLSGQAALFEKSVSMYAKIPEIVAADFRLRNGKDPIAPTKDLEFSENFFHMCFGEVPAPEVVKCFDISMTLYAEHSFNASTFTARTIASSESDIYSAVTGAIGSLKGPLHGGANEAVMHLLKEVEAPENAKDWMLTALKEKRKIMGFGHRVYRSGDSRVPTMTDAYQKMVDVIGTEEAKKYWEISRILDETMVGEKGIYPNLDFPAGPAYYLMGFEIPMFTPIFVISRITGWTAHVMEQLANNKLVRPLSAYNGENQRDVPPLDQR